jgi:predicted nucleic acid-binding Zn ribbon protein
MTYKQKTCPVCGTAHKKRGVYCSRSCGNKRPHTEEQKRKIGEKKRVWLTSGDDKAEVQKHNFIGQRNNASPDPPAITPTRLKENEFVADGDLWEEVPWRT